MGCEEKYYIRPLLYCSLISQEIPDNPVHLPYHLLIVKVAIVRHGIVAKAVIRILYTNVIGGAVKLV